MANKYTALKIDVQKAIRLYKSGMTQAEIASTLGTTQKVIWHRLNRAGFKCRVAAKRNQRGELNSSWKGNRAGNQALHCRVRSARGASRKCAMCDTRTAKKYEWANLTGDYKNVNDYIRLCLRCHRRLDLGRIEPTYQS